MQHDGRYMLDTNYRCSKDLLDARQDQGTRLLLRPSAAITYGGSASFREEPQFELPLNVYGYSKLLFDNVVRRMLPKATSQVAGFRYFNVYGPREQQRGAWPRWPSTTSTSSASTARPSCSASTAASAGHAVARLLFVDDVVAVNLWFLQNPGQGHLQPGSGRAQPFNDVADTVNARHAP